MTCAGSWKSLLQSYSQCKGRSFNGCTRLWSYTVKMMAEAKNQELVVVAVVGNIENSIFLDRDIQSSWLTSNVNHICGHSRKMIT